MAIVNTLNLYEFVDAFRDMGRDYFSWEGYEILFDYYNDLSEAAGQPFEMDVIAICCDWTEYDDFKSIYQDYDLGLTQEEDEDDEDFEDRCFEELQNHTTAYKLDNGHFLVMPF